MQIEFNSPTRPTSEVLHLAADLIERRGWARGSGWGDGTDRHALCLEGGILAALGVKVPGEEVASNPDLYYPFQQCPAYEAVQEFLGDRLEGHHLWRWNDGQRSAAHVVEVLRAAAEAEYLKERTEEVKQRLDIVPAQSAVA